MKKVLSILMALALIATLCTAALASSEASSEEPTEASFGASFAQPTVSDRIQIRTWWPSADITADEIAAEVRQIAEAGFGGIELIGITEGFDASAVDAEIYGWSTDNWNDAVSVLMQEAEKHGLSVDLTIGPRWPAGVPGLDLSGDSSSKRLNGATLHTEITDPGVAEYELPDGGDDAVFVALIAAQTDGTLAAADEPEAETEESASKEASGGPSGSMEPAKEYGIYADSLTVIPAQDIDLEKGTFTFSADKTGEWTFFAFWSVPTAQTSGATSPTAYVIDHFSLAGTEAMLGYWEDTMLTDALIDYWARNGGDLFEDSLELTSCDIPWSTAVEEFFRENKGYDIDRYLPLLMGQFQSGTAGEKYTALDNESIGSEVYNDYFRNLSDMYIENHVKVVEAWCQELNVKYRAQAQGTSDNGWVDSIEAAAYLDVVEGETLGMSKCPDSWRSLAGAANMSGTNTVSVELGAEFGALYQVSWQRLVELANRAAMAGANSFVLHGFATESQQTSYNRWPGWMPFDEPAFSEAWGSRQPVWEDMTIMTDYLSRLMTALQYGTADVDFAVWRSDMGIRTDEGYTKGVLYLDDSAMPGENAALRKGYVYNYISPGNFALDTAVVENGVLNPEYAGYRALVINNEDTMELSDAAQLLSFARAGLPIVLIGQTPVRDGTFGTEDDAAVVEVFDTLKEMDTVAWVETEDELPMALASLGIAPKAQLADEVLLGVQHRRSDEMDLYYFYNYTGSYDYSSNDVYYSDDASITTTVTLNGTGEPYILDPWSGKVTRAEDYTVNADGTVSLELTVADGQALFVALTQDPALLGEISETGKYTSLAPVSLDENGWSLTVTSFAPGELALDKSAADYDPTDTARTELGALSLDRLVSWSEIDGLSEISGTAVYSTSFTLPERTKGAVLDLGDTYDSILSVVINGTEITGIDQVTHTVDLGSYAVAGENTLTVRTGTTLAAAVRASGGRCSASDALSAYPTMYGLLGGVSIMPYGTE